MSKAVILCGGLGTRLRPFTDAIPKSLMPIGEKAILEIQIERLVSCGFTDIYLAVNHKADYIERFFNDPKSWHGAKLHFSQETKALGTAGPLKLLERELAEPFLVMNGDILTLLNFRELYDFATAKDFLLTVGVKRMTMPYAFGNIHFEGDTVLGIEEKPDIITHALAGIYVMNPGVMNYIPSNTYYGVDSLIKQLLGSGESVGKYEIKSYWVDIGQPGDYEKAQIEYAREIHDLNTPPDNNGLQ